MSLLWVSFYLDIVSLHCLLDGDKEDQVNKYDTISGYQVQHLEALCVTNVFAFRFVVHLLNQEIAPEVEDEHCW